MKKKKPNFILITIDSLRKDWLEPIGKLLDKKFVFEQALAQAPYTAGSFASFFTGLYPSQASEKSGALKQGLKTIAQFLKRAGFQTAGFHSNPFLSRAFGYHKGFNCFFDSLSGKKAEGLPQKLALIKTKAERLFRKTAYVPAPQINNKAQQWLRKNKNSPFFLWIHYMDVHGPYQSKKGLGFLNKLRAEALWHKAVKKGHLTKKEKRELVWAYQEEIAYTAEHLKNFINFLKTKGLFEQSLIIITSDHGDGFGEHGFYSHPRELYQENIHVPLLIKLPLQKETKSIKNPVGLIDITPTILDIVKVDAPNCDFKGQSLKPLFQGKSPEHFREFIISEATPDKSHQKVCLTTQKYKYIYTENPPRQELYDLVSDPKEKENLANKKPELAKKLKTKLLKNYPPGKKTARKAKSPKLDAQLSQRLKDLGYY